jgi:hypothetical protein
MTRRLALCLLPVLAFVLSAACCAGEPKPKPKEVTDMAEAKADPNFAVQGEYLGQIAAGKVGAQVIALGDGQFDVVIYKGGLPGDGWKRGDARLNLRGKTQGGATQLEGGDASGAIASGKMKLAGVFGEPIIELAKVERKSVTLGQKPPAGAAVLFDGSNADKWDNPSHLTEDKNLLSGVTSKDKFGSCKLHLEFRLSWMPTARGQGRSNSGVYVYDAYEIQVLDSFGLEGKNNECGGFYSVREPDVNMCFPPMTWQTYDIEFTAPKYDGDKKVANARITVVHNGVVIHKDLELPKDTPGRMKEGLGPRALHLQGHGNRVYYRNVWLVEK